MKILFNNRDFSTDAPRLTVRELLDIHHITPAGIAVARNGKVVRKADWASAELAEGDSVIVITAVCGG
ncbi:MAG: sulfur carrier protein ThiS [Muribaculaceae bacterium]|nr:sulfur carrier protein ThiS [Muribaculaceae bacterium]